MLDVLISFFSLGLMLASLQRHPVLCQLSLSDTSYAQQVGGWALEDRESGQRTQTKTVVLVVVVVVVVPCSRCARHSPRIVSSSPPRGAVTLQYHRKEKSSDTSREALLCSGLIWFDLV